MRYRDVARFTFAAILAAGAASQAQEFKLRGYLANYDFYRLQNKVGDNASRYDTEFLQFRFMPEVAFGEAVKIETHMVLDLSSPPDSPAIDTVTGRGRPWLPLTHQAYWNNDGVATGYFDRLNVRIHTSAADFVLGRQAITWGVNTLWPALDLFAPFPATQINRDYKSGVDAARITVPLGGRSALEAVGASLGDTPHRDWTGAGLLRFGAGHADFGFMGGRFHGDTVAGGFVTANIAGSMLRAEVARTRTGDPLDRLRKPSFWRGGLGLERQITKSVNVVVEAALNGYGATNVLGYPPIMASDRMKRGELGGPGRWHAGMTTTWRLHPLVDANSVILVNCNDTSALWMPWLSWSVTNTFDVLLGAQVSIGSRPGPFGMPRSEYGSYSTRALAGFKLYL